MKFCEICSEEREFVQTDHGAACTQCGFMRESVDLTDDMLHLNDESQQHHTQFNARQSASSRRVQHMRNSSAWKERLRYKHISDLLLSIDVHDQAIEQQAHLVMQNYVSACRDNKWPMGENGRVLSAACIYAATRSRDTPLTLQNITFQANLNHESVGKAFRLVYAYLSTQDGERVKPQQASTFYEKILSLLTYPFGSGSRLIESTCTQIQYIVRKHGDQKLLARRALPVAIAISAICCHYTDRQAKLYTNTADRPGIPSKSLSLYRRSLQVSLTPSFLQVFTKEHSLSEHKCRNTCKRVMELLIHVADNFKVSRGKWLTAQNIETLYHKIMINERGIVDSTEETPTVTDRHNRMPIIDALQRGLESEQKEASIIHRLLLQGVSVDSILNTSNLETLEESTPANQMLTKLQLELPMDELDVDQELFV